MTKAEPIFYDLTLPATTWQQPCLVATFGFPGAGKTVIASSLCDRYPFVCLTTDSIRLKYGFTSGPVTLAAMFQVAKKLLTLNHSVIFDGIHMLRKNRETLRTFGAANQAPVRFVHVIADPAVIKQRLKQPEANPEATIEAGKFVITDEHFQRIVQYYEKPDGEPDVIGVDTSSSSSPSANQLRLLDADLDVWLGDSQQ